MIKWEYNRVNIKGMSDQELDELGKDGYELISIDSNGVAYFKRPVDEEGPSVQIIINGADSLSLEMIQEMISDALDRVGMANI